MSTRPSLVVRWEELHVGVQVGVVSVLGIIVLWAGHVLLLNQPMGRGFLYALFWAIPLTIIVVAGTRTERARRRRAEGRDL